MPKQRLPFKDIREAMIDALEPEQILEIFNIDAQWLVDNLSNDEIYSELDVLQDHIHTIDLGFTEEFDK